MDTPEPLHLVPPREGPGRRKGDGVPKTWRNAAPRWTLLAALSGCIFVIGVMYARLEGAETLKAALNDAEAKTRQRMLERLAVTEEQQRQTWSIVEQVIIENRQTRETLAELSTQLRLLTAQLKRSDGR